MPKLVNYVGAELGEINSSLTRTDAVIRIFHRSGAWGLCNNSADEGGVIGADTT